MSVSGCRIITCSDDALGRLIPAQRVSRSATPPEVSHIERRRGGAGFMKRQEEACQSRRDTTLFIPAAYSALIFDPTARRSISKSYDATSPSYEQ